MSAAYTPGPWKLETVPTSCGICHKIGEFPNIRRKLNGEKEPPSYACFYVDNGDGHAEEMLANARLAAAAPDLLEALREALTHPETYSATVYGTEKQWVSKAKAAIAKVEGEK